MFKCYRLILTENDSCTDMQDLKTTLQDALPRPKMDINVASSSQSDKNLDRHPETVQEWYGFTEDVQKHKDMKPPTKQRFISRPSTGEVCPLPCNLLLQLPIMVVFVL